METARLRFKKHQNTSGPFLQQPPEDGKIRCWPGLSPASSSFWSSGVCSRRPQRAAPARRPARKAPSSRVVRRARSRKFAPLLHGGSPLRGETVCSPFGTGGRQFSGTNLSSPFFYSCATESGHCKFTPTAHFSADDNE